MVFSKQKSMASFEAGHIYITATVDEESFVSHLDFDDLAFVDYVRDIYMDRSGTLNKMASTISVKIKNGTTSVDLKNLVTVEETDGNIGLLYLIIYEGKNLPIEQIGLDLDYHARLLTIFGSEGSQEAQRVLIGSNNQSAIQSMLDERLFPGDWISFQIVVWGDYDTLYDKMNYLNDTHFLDLSVHSIQWEEVIE
jgi:hypothetical protein